MCPKLLDSSFSVTMKSHGEIRIVEIFIFKGNICMCVHAQFSYYIYYNSYKSSTNVTAFISVNMLGIFVSNLASPKQEREISQPKYSEIIITKNITSNHQTFRIINIVDLGFQFGRFLLFI